MIDTVVVATDGSESVRRCVDMSLDLADRFDADLHAVYVTGDESEDTDTVFSEVYDQSQQSIETEIRYGEPADEITTFATEIDADIVAMGTRGRHGEHRFLLGSVAEQVVRTCPVPVLTVRQLRSYVEDEG
ncbi:universal stress protein [Salinarchaeum sp. IM2453]|uniref:universal stress protein n=1 Tax=Salinarchaeum sp. IM2453 TaxID=2862870 RepID=UPI001C829F12|nr:universal stress protein [Salinarchaeum sp. IM2453]QZA87825.1 universal stress protein [Salinarchaeum sp. IM2453]